MKIDRLFVITNILINKKNVTATELSLQVTRHIDVGNSISKLRNVFKKDDTNWIEIDFSSWEESDETTY